MCKSKAKHFCETLIRTSHFLTIFGAPRWVAPLIILIEICLSCYSTLTQDQNIHVCTLHSSYGTYWGNRLERNYGSLNCTHQRDPMTVWLGAKEPSHPAIVVSQGSRWFLVGRGRTGSGAEAILGRANKDAAAAAVRMFVMGHSQSPETGCSYK